MGAGEAWPVQFPPQPQSPASNGVWHIVRSDIARDVVSLHRMFQAMRTNDIGTSRTTSYNTYVAFHIVCVMMLSSYKKY